MTWFAVTMSRVETTRDSVELCQQTRLVAAVRYQFVQHAPVALLPMPCICTSRMPLSPPAAASQASK